MKRLFILAAAAIMLVACDNKIPQEFTESVDLPPIYPDYTNVTVPVNIAPLTFQADDGKTDAIVARLTAAGDAVVCSGSKIQPTVRQWQQLVRAALTRQSPAIDVEVFMQRHERWTRFKPFRIYVSPDSIDPYVSYRLIPPSYVVYEDLTISQRCLENYDESVVYDNMLCTDGASGQCVNCHSYQQYNPERMQFHARQNRGGTVVAYDGHVKKVDLRHDSILSAGVYPAWHPWLKLIVYSTNMTAQTFHSVDPNKVEVFDTQSDLIAYNVETDQVTNVENDTTELDCFPCWAPDGKTLYYCSAHFEYRDTTDKGRELLTRTEEVKYNLYRKPFNPETMQFGPRQLVFAADSLDRSATLPRISPDGRYLMFTLARYGVFHIWHHDADLWMLDLQTGRARNVEEINSPDTESYHSWSSNSRWVVFSSRRYDGNYTRPFIAHIDSRGHAAKPFELPCADPDRHRQLLKCYNIPELMRGPVTIRPQRFADVLSREAVAVSYVRRP